MDNGIEYYITDIVNKHSDYIGKIKYNISDKYDGFKVYTIVEDGELVYNFDVEDKSMSLFMRLTIRHEIGHIIFNEIWRVDKKLIKELLSKIKKKRIFRFFQYIYYWNPIIRKIKMWLGFSSKIDYRPKDEYTRDGDFIVTRADNEYFCDWFAVFGWKKNLLKY